MSAFVILSLTLVLVVLGVTVVVARELLRNIRKLNAQLRVTAQRLTPLTQELQSEIAVTAVEVQGLSGSVERMQKERAERARQRPKRRKPQRKR